MKKIISFVGLFAVLGVGIGDAHGVAMSAQVRRLLQEKQEKIEQLEKCEGKKQGWMIAGISTIGLTAVGVGVNIAQASKSNRLSDEIEMEKSTLEKQQNDIAKEQAKEEEEEDEQKDVEMGLEEEHDFDVIVSCSSVPSSNAGDVVENQSEVQSAHDNVGDGKYCYCKITGSRPSSWVFSYKFLETGSCIKSCKSRCDGHLADYPEFRQAVLDTIK